MSEKICEVEIAEEVRSVLSIRRECLFFQLCKIKCSATIFPINGSSRQEDESPLGKSKDNQTLQKNLPATIYQLTNLLGAEWLSLGCAVAIPRRCSS